MSTDHLSDEQRVWVEHSLVLMRDLLPLMGNFARDQALNEVDRMHLGFLLTAAARSTESAFLLMAYGQLWDAEIVIRSVFEATLKFVFIVQSREHFKLRIEEYAERHFDIALMKDDQKARELLACLTDPMAMEWRPIRDMVLPDEQRSELRARYSKGDRRSLESRWGYVGILEALSRSGDHLYKGFSGLAYSYSIASHIQHADVVGVSIPMERDARSQERRESVHVAHLARLISDCFTCFRLRLTAAYRFVRCDMAPLKMAEERVAELLAEMGGPLEAWLKLEYPDE